VERAFASVTPGCFKESGAQPVKRAAALIASWRCRLLRRLESLFSNWSWGSLAKPRLHPRDPLKNAAQPVKRATARIASWRCRLLRRLESLFSKWSWGFARKASLHPRLYAVACFAGYIKRFRRPCFAGYKLNTD